MAIVFEQTATNRERNSKTCATTLSATPTEGNIVLAVGGYYFDGTDSDFSIPGFTEIVNRPPASGFSTCAWVGYKVAGASESTSHTITNTDASSAQHLSLALIEISGLDTASLVDVTASTGAAGEVTSQSTGTTGTLADADSLAIGIWVANKTLTSKSYTNSYTERLAYDLINNEPSIYVASLETSGTTGQECTLSWTTGTRVGAMMIVLAEDSASAPGAPTSVTATARSQTENTLSWTAPADDGGSALTEYRIFRESPSGGGFSEVGSGTGNTNTVFIDGALTAETEYNYKVQAVNAIGSSVDSGTDDATTMAAPTDTELAELAKFGGCVILPGNLSDAADAQQSMGMLREAISETIVGDPPVNTIGDALSVITNTTGALTGISVSHAQDSLDTVQLTVTNGTIAVDVTGGATISAGASGSTTFTLMGTTGQLNSALATVTFTSTLDYFGTAILTMLSTATNSLTDSDQRTITVTGAIVYSRTFNAGDFTEFAANNSSGATLTFPAGLNGFGKALQVERTAGAGFGYGQDNKDFASDNLRISYRINDTGVNSPTGDNVSMMALSDLFDANRVTVYHLYQVGDPTIALRIRNDSGTDIIIGPYTYTAGIHIIEARVQRATSDSSADGIGELFLDGVSLGAATTNIQNNTISTPERVRFGVGVFAQANNIDAPIIVDELIIRNDDVPIGGLAVQGGLRLSQATSGLRLAI